MGPLRVLDLRKPFSVGVEAACINGKLQGDRAESWICVSPPLSELRLPTSTARARSGSWLNVNPRPSELGQLSRVSPPPSEFEAATRACPHIAKCTRSHYLGSRPRAPRRCSTPPPLGLSAFFCDRQYPPTQAMTRSTRRRHPRRARRSRRPDGAAGRGDGRWQHRAQRGE